MKISQLLYCTERKLQSRINRNAWFYTILVSISCVLFLTYISIVFFYYPINEIEQLQVLFNLTIYMIFFLDMGFVLKKFGEGAVIEPYHLSVYPLSQWQKFKFQCFLLIIDFKSTIYISSVIFFAAFFVIKSMFFNALYSVVVIFFFYITVLNWLMVVYYFAGKILRTNRNNISFLILGLAFFLLGIQSLGGLELINKVPLISNTGNTLFGLFINDWDMVLNNMGILMSILFIGITVNGYLVANKRWGLNA